MGLDTTHDCWHGPYSSFGEWRRRIARALGFDLLEMKGFGGTVEWSSLTPDPLHILLSHSDCDGHIEVADCLPIAQRLDEIANDIKDDPQPYYRAKTFQFAEGLRNAAELGERVEFH